MTENINELIAQVEADERRLVLTRFSNDDAWKLGTILMELATTRDLAVTIDIRRGNQQLFHAARPGTSAHNDVWIQRKVNTVQEHGISSFLAGLRARVMGHTFEEAPWIDAQRFAGHGGGFPISVTGAGVIGVVTVSGLPQADDHALAVEALGILQGAESSVTKKERRAR